MEGNIRTRFERDTVIAVDNHRMLKGNGIAPIDIPAIRVVSVCRRRNGHIVVPHVVAFIYL